MHTSQYRICPLISLEQILIHNMLYSVSWDFVLKIFQVISIEIWLSKAFSKEGRIFQFCWYKGIVSFSHYKLVILVEVVCGLNLGNTGAKREESEKMVDSVVCFWVSLLESTSWTRCLSGNYRWWWVLTVETDIIKKSVKPRMIEHQKLWSFMRTRLSWTSELRVFGRFGSWDINVVRCSIRRCLWWTGLTKDQRSKFCARRHHKSSKFRRLRRCSNGRVKTFPRPRDQQYTFIISGFCSILARQKVRIGSRVRQSE